MAHRVRNHEVPDYLAFVRRALRGLTNHVVASGDPSNLAALSTLSADLEAAMTDAVRRLRVDYGFSWQSVGDALGTSRQAAQKRFGDGGTDHG